MIRIINFFVIITDKFETQDLDKGSVPFKISTSVVLEPPGFPFPFSFSPLAFFQETDYYADGQETVLPHNSNIYR